MRCIKNRSRSQPYLENIACLKTILSATNPNPYSYVLAYPHGRSTLSTELFFAMSKAEQPGAESGKIKGSFFIKNNLCHTQHTFVIVFWIVTDSRAVPIPLHHYSQFSVLTWKPMKGKSTGGLVSLAVAGKNLLFIYLSMNEKLICLSIYH